MSEYVPERWEGRKWISGFNGSAGTAVVTLRSAALWTDSRYFIAAEQQLEGTEFQLMRERMESTPSIADWLARELQDADSTEVGIDGMCIAKGEAEGLKAELRHAGGLTLRTNLDILNRVWTDRPPVPLNKVEIHPLEYAGESVAEKLCRIRTEMRRAGASCMLVTQLDDIAWTLNLRGTDVHCTPVFVAWLIVGEESATLYIKEEKLTPDVVDYLHAEGVAIDEYDNVIAALNECDAPTMLVDPSTVNSTLAQPRGNYTVVSAQSPIPTMKAVKNHTEREGFRRAMERDGVAMVQFLKWLEEAVPKGSETELTASAKLYQLRAGQPKFRDISFDTIAAYADHAAIVHYEPTPLTDVKLEPKGLLLLDSGAQYSDGTTDITRTIALGDVTDRERRVYTLVLKGHLALQNLCFPRSASGTQLDAVARTAMWREGMNFMHGTGHGRRLVSQRARGSSPDTPGVSWGTDGGGHDRNRRAWSVPRRSLRRAHREHAAHRALRDDGVRTLSALRAAHALPHRHQADNQQYAQRRGTTVPQRLPRYGVRAFGTAARRGASGVACK